ncbi:Oxidoreductase-like protein [Cordyceps javanica]|uniref:Oxidoreductase-like protein n=1 Tax=Cordyceps javanica TaxID=43265 RepID=A0A545V831_9HYPO|nr:Oxidoreductase-like protein [Cordyceps javanica]TQW08943.1 Oxidoreductase-like protein [Cordyceps javanica]
MSAPSRLAPRVCRLCRLSSPAFRRAFASATTTTTTKSSDSKPQQQQQPTWPQRQPRGEYYDILLRDPTPYAATKAEEPPSSSVAAAAAVQSPPPSSPTKDSAAELSRGGDNSSRPAKTYETISSRTAYSDSNSSSAAERARVIFGSRLLGPAERADRAAGRQARSTTVAGVRVPPRPEEPDNCCMSGCVNCVWELYREEMEEWTLQSNEAKKRLAESAAAAAAAAAGSGGKSPGLDAPPPPSPPPPPAPASSSSSSMDADSGGSEMNWPVVGDTKIAKDLWTDDMFQNVPVGIREFMKQEKRLKEKHEREGTSGG